MKKFIFFARVFTCLIFVVPFAAGAQNNESNPYYVVIGAFAKQRNAINFRGEAKTSNYAARFELNPGRNLFYVYVLNTADRELAIEEALKLREKSKYFDTWVYNGYLGKFEATRNQNSGTDINPVTGQSFKSTGTEQNDSPDRNSNTLNSPPEARDINKSSSTITGKKGKSSTSPELAAKVYRQKSAGSTNSDILKSNNNSLPTAGGDDGKNETVAATSSEKKSPLATTQKNSDTANENIVSIDQVRKKDDGNLSVANQQESSNKQNAGLSKVGPGVKPPPVTDGQKSLSVTQKNSTKLNENDFSPDGSQTKNVEIPIAANQKTSSIKTNTSLPAGGKIDSKTEQQGASIKSADKTKSNLSPGASALKSPSVNQQNVDSLRKDNSPLKPDNDLGTTPATKVEEIVTPTEPLSSEDVIGKNFYFKLFRATNKAVVEGEVDVIDSEKSRRMSTLKGNTPVKVLMPAGKSKVILFVSDVFGYRKLQKEFNPDSPSEDLYLDENGNLVVPFELVRLQKGDIAIMYNVFFFKDAAVMRPESRYEVNNLLELLNENPSYKIIIHGHTNGNANGKILNMGSPESFYSLTGAKEDFGSAKKLSEERALVMKQYLLSKGIADDRIQVKAWGGKKPLHDKHAVRAQENVRVEIEILSK